MVAQLDAEIVLHELDEHVSASIVARHHPWLDFPALVKDRALDIVKVICSANPESRRLCSTEPILRPGNLSNTPANSIEPSE